MEIPVKFWAVKSKSAPETSAQPLKPAWRGKSRRLSKRGAAGEFTAMKVMSPPAPHVLIVVASLQRAASTRAVLQALAEQLRAGGCQVDLLDLLEEPLGLF